MVGIDQRSFETLAAGNIFDDPENAGLLAPVMSRRNSPAYDPYPPPFTLQAPYGHLHPRVRAACHIFDAREHRRQRNRIIEALPTQTIKRFQRTAVYALKAFADPDHLHETRSL